MSGEKDRRLRAAFLPRLQQTRGNIGYGLVPAHGDEACAASFRPDALQRLREAVGVVNKLLERRAFDAKGAFHMGPLRLLHTDDPAVINGCVDQTGL